MTKNILRNLLHPLSIAWCMLCFCNCGAAQDGPFEYKEIYLPEKDSQEAKDLNLNNVDADWGIWGHHLSVVLPKNYAPSVCAQVDGRRVDSQFCFSSEQLYLYIEKYIVDNFGESDEQRFAILPNDNDLVCTCDLCRQKGNTKTNATPAVSYMLERLAKRFDNHLFFTSYYMTTRNVPRQTMPKNTGVLVSTMSYPLRAVDSKAEADFKALLKQWKEKMEHVYVWDYINNFDDYMTPFPVLGIMQRRLKLYVDAGVNGVFLNGSGTDYSSLSRLHLNVIGQLLRDPDSDWQKLVGEKCRSIYPTAGNLIAQFVLDQEKWTAQQGRVLPLYGGVSEARKTYLPEQAFTQFHDSLLTLIPKAGSAESSALLTMWQAMALTRLELNRLNNNVADSRPLIDGFKSLPAKNIRIYSESFWYVDSYAKDYAEMVSHREATQKKNLLKGQQLVAMTALDEEYSDISILTDGLLGLPSNYHCGQMLSSADPHLKIAIPHVDGMRHLKVYLVNNPKFHIILPERVTLSAGDTELASVVPQLSGDDSQRAVVELPVPAKAEGTLMLTLRRNTADRTMAIDEIEAY